MGQKSILDKIPGMKHTYSTFYSRIYNSTPVYGGGGGGLSTQTYRLQAIKDFY